MPEVWKFGPVFPSLYYELKYHGGNSISTPEKDNLVGPAPMIDRTDMGTRSLIQQVWDKFHHTTAMQLSTKTHRTGTPWHNIAEQSEWRVPRHTEIKPEALRAYFSTHGLNG